MRTMATYSAVTNSNTTEAPLKTTDLHILPSAIVATTVLLLLRKIALCPPVHKPRNIVLILRNSMWDSSKDQDPAYIGLEAYKSVFIDSIGDGINGTLAQCSSLLGNFSCVDYGYSAYGQNASDFAKPTPLHSATGTWSDTNGILTAPVSGATYTWTARNATVTVTAVSVDAVATRSASATGKESGSTTGSATGKSGTASGASSTSAGAAPTLMAAQYPAAALMGLGGLAFALL
jgi:hypothetical protein